MVSWTAAISAGSPSAGSTRESAIGDTHRARAAPAQRGLDSGGHDGPISMGRARRCRLRSMSRHTLVAIRYSQERTLERPSKRSAARQARTIVSCTASSASKPEPSMR